MVATLVPLLAFQAPYAPDFFELLWVAVTIAISFAIMIALGAWWSH